MGYQSIKTWPEGERPRERLLKCGAGALSDAQILAIMLRTGGGGKSALDLAMEMLNLIWESEEHRTGICRRTVAFQRHGRCQDCPDKGCF